MATIFLLSKVIKLDRYVMLIPKKIFDVVGYIEVFSTLNLRFGYHQLQVKNGDKYKKIFWKKLMNLERIDCINGRFFHLD